jgi:hypothetical protein
VQSTAASAQVNKIQEAGAQVDDLGNELNGILTSLRAEIDQ